MIALLAIIATISTIVMSALLYHASCTMDKAAAKIIKLETSISNAKRIADNWGLIIEGVTY